MSEYRILGMYIEGDLSGLPGTLKQKEMLSEKHQQIIDRVISATLDSYDRHMELDVCDAKKDDQGRWTYGAYIEPPFTSFSEYKQVLSRLDTDCKSIYNSVGPGIRPFINTLEIAVPTTKQ